jgi:predicted O-methyltransferase YrrM
MRQVLGRLAVANDFVSIIDRLNSIEGFLMPLEGYALLLMAQHGPGIGAVVEIGSYLGRSTCFLAIGAQRAGRPAVVAVDHFEGSPEHQAGESHQSSVLVAEGTTYNQFLQNLERAKVSDHVKPVRSGSLEAAKNWSGPIRLLFIDGDHSYQSSRDDFGAWSANVESNGLVAFHDVGVWPGVTGFYKELLAEGRWREQASVQSLRVVARA